MRTNTKMIPISQGEHGRFFCRLNAIFELQILKKKGNLPSIDRVSKVLGVTLYWQNNTSTITRIDRGKMQENEFYFWSKNKKTALYYLWRHLRNCVSHGKNIKYFHEAHIKYYYLTDKNKNGFTMKGVIRADMWESFLNSLEKISGVVQL